MGEIWASEMRYKNKLSQRGKGNRRNRRMVQLARSDFERVSYFEASHGLNFDNRKTSEGKAGGKFNPAAPIHHVGAGERQQVSRNLRRKNWR